LISLAACSAGTTDDAPEDVASTHQALLATACSTAGGNMALTLQDGEVGYVGRIAGCTTEPCVYANAKDSSGNLCVVASTGKTISVTGAGATTDVEKMVFDFSNGLFAVATTASPLMSVALDSPVGSVPASKVMIIPPVGGGNMALGVSGLDVDALTTRGATQHLDMTIAGNGGGEPGPTFEFNGGLGNDIFTGDIAGWSTALPTGWATAAALATVVGAPTTLNLTISGGPGNDTLAGGAGSNTLMGGPGNDIFLQSSTSHAETIQGGDGVDTIDYSARSAALFVTPNSDTGLSNAGITVPAASGTGGAGYAVGDILSVAGGTAGLMATLQVTAAPSGVITTATVLSVGDGYVTGTGIATTAITGVGAGATIDITAVANNDGQAGEGDSVGLDVEIVNGGSGNDILNAHAVVVTDVVLNGNGGNDQLTGGGGNDDLCGGAGNDTFYENPGNDNLVGGAGLDTADYSTGTSVVSCLNVADTAAGKTCVAQNGGKFGGVAEMDLVNGVLAKVCPRATLNVGVAAGGTAMVAPTTPGSAMAVDVENVTGNPAAANTLRCGTLACTVFGGTGSDTIVGSPLADQIFGLGGSDNVTTNGGDDLVDLTGSTTGSDTVNCNNNAVTILLSGGDTLNNGGMGTNCGTANLP